MCLFEIANNQVLSINNTSNNQNSISNSNYEFCATHFQVMICTNILFQSFRHYYCTHHNLLYNSLQLKLITNSVHIAKS